MKYLKTYEDIRIPIKVGDVILGGRFKNKKILVKKIGKNKKGDITINGKPLLRFRIIKEDLKYDVDYYFSGLKDIGFSFNITNDVSFKSYIEYTNPILLSMFKPIDSSDEYRYSNCKPFKFSEMAEDISRFISELTRLDIPYSSYIIKKVYGLPKYTKLDISEEDILNEDFNEEVLSFTLIISKLYNKKKPI